MHHTRLLFSISFFVLLGFLATFPAKAQVANLPAKARFLLKFGGYGTANGKFILPMGIAIDKNDNIYVVDHQNHRIQKFNSSGKFISKFGSFGTGNGQFNWPIDVVIDAQGNIYVADRDNHRIQKFNSSGQFVSKFGSKGTADGQLYEPNSIAVDAAGNIYVAQPGHGDISGPRIQKFSSSGQFLLTFGSKGTADEQFVPSDIILDTAGNIYVVDAWNQNIKKFNSNGKFLSKFGSYGTANGQFIGPRAIALDAVGNIYVCDRELHHIQKFNSKGQFLLKFGSRGSADGQFIDPSGLAIDSEGNLYVTEQSFDFLVIKFAIEEAVLTPNYIKGTIYNDTNKDCVQDTAEKGIEGMVVVAQPGNHYASTDSLGNYMLAVDTGSYTIEQVIPNTKSFIKQIYPINPATHSVRFTASNDSVLGKNFANQLIIQPYLSVSVSSDRRRRCMTNITTVSYCNSGTAAATNVKVYVKLPEYIILKSANSAYTVDKDSNYVFTIESLAAKTCGSIQIQDSVICADIQGLIQCTSAWITPANSRTPAANWDQSDILVKAKCIDDGNVRLSIYNYGSGSMADSSAFRIYLDAQLAFMSDFKLAKGDSLILQVPANGQTVRLEADQCPDHPSRKQSFITIEACGTNSSGSVSKGYVTQQAQEEEEPEISTECLPIIDSFDPNDKVASPQGVGLEHYTPTNTALDYVVRFQNTGTDTAYKVVVVDTLSEHFDMKTLQIGAVSHAYKLNISGKGRPVLTFTFNNINLPDSTKDQAGSNGFIRFSIKPKADLPEKTILENFADIFFDFNKPVRTNTVFNSIYDIPAKVVESAKLEQSIVCHTTNTTIQAGTSRSVCEQGTVSMQAITPIVGKGQWKLMSGGGILQDRESANTIISGLAYGENVFEWSIPANSCGTDSLRAQVTIIRQMKPATPVITQVGADSLACSITGNSYEWQLNGVDLTINTQQIKADSPGKYTVRVKNQQKCISDLSAAFTYVLTAIDSHLSTSIIVYPNPTNGNMTLILPAELGQKVEVSLWDALSRNVMNKNLTINSNQYKEVFDLSTEKPGVYLLKIQTSEGVIFRRIIKK